MSGWYCYTCDQISVPQGLNPTCSTCGGSYIVQLEFPSANRRVTQQQQQQQPGFLPWIYNYMTGTISQLINTYNINQEIRSLSVPVPGNSGNGRPNFTRNQTWIIPYHEVYHEHQGIEGRDVTRYNVVGPSNDYVRSPHNVVYDGHGNTEDHDITIHNVEGSGEDVGLSNTDVSSPTPCSQALIDSLPKIKVSRNDKHLSPHCTICMERFEVGNKAKRLPCKHIFHPGCIDPWLTTRANTCPICRQEVTTGRRQEVTTGRRQEVTTGRRQETIGRRIPYSVHTCPHHGRRWWQFC